MEERQVIIFSSKCESKLSTIFGAVAMMIIAAAVAMFAFAGCSGSSGGNGLDLKVGASVIFGSYEQDGNESNGPEPIEWRVLSIEDDKALLISEYGLDCMPFNFSSEVGVDWNDSDLKKWLEGEFTNEAFNPDEQLQIAEATCLSIEEAKTTFSTDGDRMCTPTEYAVSRGVVANDGTGACKWWLRSVDYAGESCGVDSYDGHICENGIVDRGDVAVRPAIWVNL